MIRALLHIALAILLAGSTAAAGEMRSATGGAVHALVVGIDDYAAVRPRLQGSVGDALDIAAALHEGGVGDVTLLLDRAATRGAFVAAMTRLVEASASGDLVLISYSGHGATVPEYPQFRGLEPGGRTEEFVMAGFGPNGAANGEVVANKEMKAWLTRLDAKRVHVLFIADSCFGGGMVRGLPDPRVGSPLLRVAPDAAPVGEGHFQPIAMTDAEMHVDVGTLTHVTVVSGSDRFTPVPEVFIPEPPTRRGALSFAVARALRGLAAKPGSVETTRRQLFAYVKQQVQHFSDDQRIDRSPGAGAAGLDEGVFRLLASGEAAASAAVPPACPTVHLAVIHDGAGDAARLGDLGAPYTLAADPAGSDIVWDAAAGEVVGSAGDVIAHGIGASALAGVVRRTAAVQCLKSMTVARPQALSLRDGLRRYAPGDAPMLEAPDLAGRSLVAFDVAGDGRIQLIWPPSGRDAVMTEARWTAQPEVVAPYGADMVVAVSAEGRLDDLLRWLEARNDRLPSPAGELPQQLRQLQARDATVRIGTVPLYTGAR